MSRVKIANQATLSAGILAVTHTVKPRKVRGAL